MSTAGENRAGNAPRVVRLRPGKQAEVSLLAAMQRGEDAAAERFFARYGDRLHALFRMTLDTASEAEAAVSATLADAVGRAGEFASSDHTDTGSWMMDLALEQIAERARRNGSPYSVMAAATESRERAHSLESTRSMLSAVSDRTLAVLLRTLDPTRRRALVLGVIHGLEDDRVARAIGADRTEVEGVKQAALEDMRDLLAEHHYVQERRAALVGEVPYHLRPLRRPLATGHIVVKGTRAYVAPGSGLMHLARKAIARFIELLGGHGRLGEFDYDDEIGGPEEPLEAPLPTPGTPPLERPELTPSLRGYEAPRSTPGSARHRAPKGTPSIARLSNPRRALPAGARVYGWGRKR